MNENYQIAAIITIFIAVFAYYSQQHHLNSATHVLSTQSKKQKLVWKQLPTTNTILERSSHGTSIVSADGIPQLVVFGGENIARTPIDNTVHVLNLSDSDTWTWQEKILSPDNKDIDIPKARIAHAQASIGSKIYIFGGRLSTTMEEAPLNDLYSFDVGTSKWQNLSLVTNNVGAPSPRSFHKMVAVEEMLYVFGGCGANGRLSDLYSFDTISNVWSKLPSMLSSDKEKVSLISGRGGAGFTASADHKSLFIVGGFSGKEMNDVFRYDIDSQRYYEIYRHGDEKNPLRPFSVSCGGVVNGNILFFGGEVDPSQNGHEGAGDFSDKITVLNGIDGQAITDQTAHKFSGNTPLARGWSDAAVLRGRNGDDKLVVFGGLSGDDENPKRLNDVWILETAT